MYGLVQLMCGGKGLGGGVFHFQTGLQLTVAKFDLSCSLEQMSLMWAIRRGGVYLQ